MRCSKCGKLIKRNSKFCAKCGAELPPAPKKEKKPKKEKLKKEKKPKKEKLKKEKKPKKEKPIKEKKPKKEKIKKEKKPKKEKKKKEKKIKIKGQKRKSKARIAIPIFTVLILGMLTFLIFGGEKVPEPIRNLKGYSYLTGVVKEKLPDQLPFGLPKKFPFDFSFQLPFDLPDPGSLLGDSELPDEEKIKADLAEFESKEEHKAEIESLEIEKRTADKKGKKDTVYVLTVAKSEEGTEQNYYRLQYKRHLIGGWKLDEVKPYNVEGENTSVAGVSNKTVLKDETIYSDIGSDWKYDNAKVLEHYTDVEAGLDTVVVYMELENEYVKMAGVKKVVYQYDDQTKKWTAVEVSKLMAQKIEPINLQ